MMPALLSRTPGNPDGIETPVAIIGALALSIACGFIAWIAR